MTQQRSHNLARVVLVVLIAVALARFGEGWPVDNRVDAWAATVGRDGGYDLLRRHFGGDEGVLVRIDRFDAASPSVAPLVRRVVDGLREQEGVLRVFDPLDLPVAVGRPLGERLAALSRSRVVQRLDAIALDPPRVDLLVALDADRPRGADTSLAEAVAAARSAAEASGQRLRAAGHPLVAAGLDRESARVDRVFAPLLVVFGMLACALLLRSAPLAFATLLPGALASLALRAGYRAVGIDANMILVAGAPLVFVVLVASTLHLTTRFQRRLGRGASPTEAALGARDETLRAALLAAFTTAVGFSAFAFSDVRAVRHLGLGVAAVVALGVPLTYAALPSLLAGLRRTPARSVRRSTRRWRRVAGWATRRRLPVLAVAGAVTVLGAVAPRRMGVSTDAFEFFPADHPVRVEFESLEAEGGSLSTLEVVIEVGGSVRVDGAELGELAQRIAASKGVHGVLDASAILADLVERLGPVAARLALPGVLLDAGCVSPGDPRLARMTVRLASSRMDDIDRVREDLGGVVRTWEREQHDVGRSDLRAHVTGSLARLHTLHDALVRTLASSLGLTSSVALVAFFLFLRGARERLAAIAANAAPVAASLAVAWAMGFALDAATVMVASVVMGIALDTTFHLFVTARSGNAGVEPRRAALRSFGAVGDAAATSAVVLCVGFGSLTLADFVPTARFGFAAAVGVAVALAADLLVVPALWIGRARGRARP